MSQSGRILKLHIGTGEIELQNSEVLSIASNPAQTLPRETPVAERDNTREVVARAAVTQGLDPDFVGSVASVESAFARNAVSAKGALGLMQLMPSTARSLGVNPALANENALGGAKYLRSLLLKYHNNSALALAAYNAGPGAVSRFGGVPPFIETQNYIRNVTREYDRRHLASLSQSSGRPGRIKKPTAPGVSGP